MLRNILDRNAASSRARNGQAASTSPIVARCRFLDAHVFIHTHIEKTAGSALLQGLGAVVGWAHSMDVRGEASLHAAGMSAEERALIRLYSGHFNYGVHRHFAQRPLYIAAVRPPADRAVSYYRYCVERTGHPNHRIFADKSFEEAFDHMDATGHAVARNGQAQRVMGDAFRDGITGEEVVGHVRDAYFAVVPQPRVGPMINAIRRALDLPPMPLPQFNVGQGPAVDLTPRLKHRINHRNAADVALVIEARDAFKETVERVQDHIAECARRAMP